MSLDDERNENMGRPKGSASICDDGPRSARCETCGFCAVSEAVMTASGEGRKRYTCMRCPDFVHATQGLKPLEEAAEVYGAWQDCDDMRLSPIMTARREYRQNLIDECMDVVQAVVSLLDAEGFTQEDVDAAIERCNERNRERGRL